MMACMHHAPRGGLLRDSYIRTLLQCGAAVEAKNKRGRTAAFNAAWNGNLVALQVLHEEGDALLNTADVRLHLSLLASYIPAHSLPHTHTNTHILI